MKKIILIFLLYYGNFLFGQDQASNKGFSKFLNTNSTTSIKSYVDENGVETILAIALSSIYLNNNLITVSNAQLMVFRHSIWDTANFSYSYLSDPSKGLFSYNSITELCRTKNGYGFMINFGNKVINLKTVPTATPKLLNNSIFVEFDATMNIVSTTKFGSAGTFNINKCISDQQGNLYALLNGYNTIYLNDTINVNQSKINSFCSIRDNTLRWTEGIVNVTSMSAIQMIENNYKIYFYSYMSGSNITINGRVLKAKSALSLSVITLDSSGNVTHDFATDSINNVNPNYGGLLVSGGKVFLSIPYSTYLDAGGKIFTKNSNFYASVFFEMDTALNILNHLHFSSLFNYTISMPKAYNEIDGLLYLDVYNISASGTFKPTVINDTFLYFNNFRHYYNYQEAHNIFAYNVNSRVLASAYDYTTNVHYFSNIFIPPFGSTAVYADVFLSGNIKLEGKIYTDNNVRRFSFQLNKPYRIVVPPSRVMINRKPGNTADITWINNDQYDSIQLERYEIQAGQVNGNFRANGGVTHYADNLTYYPNFNYYFKVRGFRGGEPSIWSSSDSSSTADSLKIDRYIYASLMNESDVAVFWGNDNTPAINIYSSSVFRSYNRYTGFTKIATVGKTVKNYLDTTTVKGKYYYYFVMDHNSLYESSSDTIEVKFGGTINLGTKDYRVYPNPCKNILQFELLDNTKTSVTIFDALGRMFELMLKENNGTYQADVSKLPGGMYILRQEQSGKIYTTRIIKQE